MPKKLKLKPLGDRVLVREIVEQEQEAGGIVLPEDVKSEDFLKAEVLEIGTDTEEIQVKKGDKVLIDGFASKVLEMGDTEYRIVKAEEILAIVK